MHSFGGTLAGSHHHRFRNLFLAHSLPADFSLFTDLLQAVFAGNSGHRSNERHPSATGFDFVETQDQTRMQSRLDRADMPLDFLPRFDRQPVRGGQRLSYPRPEVIASFHGTRVQPVGKLDQSYGSLRNRVGGR
jgi:hypothetical protein